MEKFGFVGAYDKTDFIIYIAKILTVLGKRVIVIDSTLNQKAKYIVPVINPTKSYVTQYEDFDVAVGFIDFEEIEDYLGIEKIESLYDIALIDTDSSKVFEKFDMYTAQRNYFVTSFDLYSLKKGLEILSGLRETIKMKKVLFSRNQDREEDDYLNFLSSNYKIVWNEEIIYFPFEQGDMSTIIENQRVSRIKLKNLTPEYLNGFSMLAQEITGVSMYDLKKVYKLIEKG